MALSNCVITFILTILCGNPILKGTFVTLLSSIVAQLDEEIAVLTLELGRLNVVNQVLQLEIQAEQAIVNKITADFNLVLGPLNASGTCPELAQLTKTIQNSGAGKFISGLQNKIYEANRTLNLTNIQNSILKQTEQERNQIQEMINQIASLCP